jgi:hypothetical protein
LSGIIIAKAADFKATANLLSDKDVTFKGIPGNFALVFVF